MVLNILDKNGFPDSCKNVFSVIVKDGPLSSKEIVSKVSCSTRSVRYALKRLLEDEYIEKRPCLRDMRQSLYSANIDKLIGELQVLRGVR